MQSLVESMEQSHKEKANEWCRQYLKGPWSTIGRDKIHVELLRGYGLSNYLYKCTIPSDETPKASSIPSNVLVRIYADVLANPGGSFLETAICALLAEKNEAPKIYGICQEGRLEEFVQDLIVMELCQSRTLNVDDLRSKTFGVEIARKLAEYHCMDMPLRKEPIFLLETCEKGYDLANYFCEWTFDYRYEEFPCFKYSPDNYPTKEQRQKFIRTYLSCYKEYKSASVEGKKKIEFDLLTEIERLSIFCHFFWAIWRLFNRGNPVTNLDFWTMH
ncbi:choline/ethanolamine kinase-like [Ptychodera flava]|uniref:choline/ethanolamine kinase-like n=1 Tax=Ptychodera flava TaxID=63121 RepID=UPI003969D1CF